MTYTKTSLTILRRCVEAIKSLPTAPINNALERECDFRFMFQGTIIAMRAVTNAHGLYALQRDSLTAMRREMQQCDGTWLEWAEQTISVYDEKE